MTTGKPLLCVLVDAFRHDYLDEGRTPFLWGMAAEGGSAPLPTILGYSDAVRATIFTGAYPDAHGYWMEYRFDEETGDPFGPFSRMGWLDAFPSDFALRGMKYVLSATAMRALARRRGYPSLDLRHIPFGALRFFDYTLRSPMTAPGALPLPTIFDRLSQADLPWAYLSSADVSERAMHDHIGAMRTDAAVVFVYLHHLDMVSHLHGISGDRFERVLRETDERVERLAAAVRARMGEPEVLVFSDHGMSPVRRFVSLPGLRRHPSFGTGFCFALDATTVRVWYLRDDPSIVDDVRAYVAARMPGRWLSAYERRGYRLPVNMRPWGDDIYLTEPGVVIFPNFHSYVRPKAMHAYDPADPDQDGIVVATPGVDLPASPRLVDLSGLMQRMTGAASTVVERV
jgi:hypothetical protein